MTKFHRQTMTLKRLRREVRNESTPASEERPRVRAECGTVRPCPFVSCRYHLYLDVTRGRGLKLNHPDKEPWELEQTCALDVAELHGAALHLVGRLLSLTQEGVRRVEATAFKKLRCALGGPP